MRRTINDLVQFEDHALARKWANKSIPMSDVYEAYVEQRLDIPEQNWDDFFKYRHDAVDFRITSSLLKWAATNYLPEVLVHSRKQDKRIVGDHYNRGNDFFQWFLGEAMVYTAAYFESPDDCLQTAQYKKIDRCCEKLQLKKGESLLDIGCGWGTFVARAAQKFGANCVGVTLAQEQVEFGTQRIAEFKVESKARVEVRDYRELRGTFDKIVSLEMVEHVGIKNLDQYFSKAHELLKPDGSFVLQWTGIRDLYAPNNPFKALRLRPEDLSWAIFMNRHIFQGADASLPLSSMLRAAENAGFEISSVEPMSANYVLTLKAWRKNWIENKNSVIEAYGEKWFRLWNFFLQWSALIGEQGTATCYQVLMHKNHESFARERFSFPGNNTIQ